MKKMLCAALSTFGFSMCSAFTNTLNESDIEIKNQKIVNDVNKTAKFKEKNPKMYKALTITGKVIGGYAAIKCVADSIDYIIVRHSLKQFDSVKNGSLQERINAFKQVVREFLKDYIYFLPYANFSSILDMLLLKTKKQVIISEASKVLLAHRGVCRNLASLCEYWLSYLDIPNYKVISYVPFSNDWHIFSIFWDNDHWALAGLVGRNNLFKPFTESETDHEYLILEPLNQMKHFSRRYLFLDDELKQQLFSGKEEIDFSKGKKITDIAHIFGSSFTITDRLRKLYCDFFC